MEPDPSNVTGEVVHRHSFEHRVNWGYVAVAFAALVVVYILFTESDAASDAVSALEEDSEEDVW
jgi:hypothetical protein